MLTLTQVNDLRLNEFLKDEEESPRYWIDSDGNCRDRDNKNRFAAMRLYDNQELDRKSVFPDGFGWGD